MNSYYEINISLLIIQTMSLQKQSFGLTINMTPMMVSILASPIVHCMLVVTIRLLIFKISSYLIQTRRSRLLKLSSYDAYQELSYQVLRNIQQLCW